MSKVIKNAISRLCNTATLKTSFLRLFLLTAVVLSASCIAPIEIFEQQAAVEEVDHIGNFYATEVFNDQISKELWFSPDGGCLNVSTTTENVYSGTGALHVQWDKGKGGCDWIGMGIGWENWSGKNFGSIYDHSALSFQVRTDGRPIKALPIAIALEDHGNLQAWTGFSRNMLDAGEITSEWSTVTIPILSFNWSQFDADISNIKQMIIQFEASGDVFIDEIKIVEHKGSLRAKVEVPLFKESMKTDEVFKAMTASDLKPAVLDKGKVQLAFNDNHLFVLADIADSSPLQNTRSGDKIWDGDAIEIAFSSNAASEQTRSYFLFSDHQVGVRASDEAFVWDWKGNSQIKEATYNASVTEAGYQLKASIPLSALGISAHEIGSVYGLEIAIDQGNNDGRKRQIRWNEPDIGGFYENPSLWGEMKIVAR